MFDSILEEIVRRITALERRDARLEEIEGGAGAAAGCRVYRNSNQSINHNTLTALAFNTEVADTGDCWSSASPTRLYARRAGYYMAGGQFHMTLGAQASSVLLAVRINGANYRAQQALYASANREVALAVTTSMFYMDVDDYVEIIVRQIQASGSAAIDVSGATEANQQFNNGWLMRIG